MPIRLAWTSAIFLLLSSRLQAWAITCGTSRDQILVQLARSLSPSGYVPRGNLYVHPLFTHSSSVSELGHSVFHKPWLNRPQILSSGCYVRSLAGHPWPPLRLLATGRIHLNGETKEVGQTGWETKLPRCDLILKHTVK